MGGLTSWRRPAGASRGPGPFSIRGLKGLLLVAALAAIGVSASGLRSDFWTAFTWTSSCRQRLAPIPAVARTLYEASRRTGVDFPYLLAAAGFESGYCTLAKSAGSSAGGLFQFVEGTWLEMIREHGARHGLDRYARAVMRTPQGTARVGDRKLRQEILDLRHDPRVAALMAAEYARQNRRHLETRLGRRVARTDLYLAHLLGAGGAARFLREMEANPARPATRSFAAAAKANRAVFYDGATPKSMSAVYDGLRRRLAAEGRPWGRHMVAAAFARFPVSLESALTLTTLTYLLALRPGLTAPSGAGLRGARRGARCP